MLKADDPALLRAEIERLKTILSTQTEEIIQLREALRPPEWEPPIEIGLTTHEARLVASLYKANGEAVSKERLFYATYHDRIDQPEIKIIDVYICKLRKKLNLYGIEVKTVHGRGYYLDQESITIIRDWGIDPHDEMELKAA